MNHFIYHVHCFLIFVIFNRLIKLWPYLSQVSLIPTVRWLTISAFVSPIFALIMALLEDIKRVVKNVLVGNLLHAINSTIHIL